MAKIANTKKSAKSSSTSSCCSQSLNEQVAKLAYQFYLERGSVDGYDREDWLRAEAIVKKKGKKS